jgi:spore germination cell wall hydrolase CwlJ-like protein
LWKGLIGEAVGEGYIGMYAVACVYKNRLARGMSLGCVALRRPDIDRFVERQGVKYERRAKAIIKEVFEKSANDITGGATHYEYIEKYGIPRWAKNMKITTKIGNHTFYKE